ncbi:MAG: hypothetical protein M0Z51_17015 [Propionibacterium sp.]|nr:hypothetical protein [Propionibacterium sp.]
MAGDEMSPGEIGRRLDKLDSGLAAILKEMREDRERLVSRNEFDDRKEVVDRAFAALEKRVELLEARTTAVERRQWRQIGVEAAVNFFVLAALGFLYAWIQAGGFK